MTTKQCRALMRLINGRLGQGNVAVTVMPRPFELPEGYVGVLLRHSADLEEQAFYCGIAPDGAVSS